MYVYIYTDMYICMCTMYVHSFHVSMVRREISQDREAALIRWTPLSTYRSTDQDHCTLNNIKKKKVK